MSISLKEIDRVSDLLDAAVAQLRTARSDDSTRQAYVELANTVHRLKLRTDWKNTTIAEFMTDRMGEEVRPGEVGLWLRWRGADFAGGTPTMWEKNKGGGPGRPRVNRKERARQAVLANGEASGSRYEQPVRADTGEPVVGDHEGELPEGIAAEELPFDPDQFEIDMYDDWTNLRVAVDRQYERAEKIYGRMMMRPDSPMRATIAAKAAGVKEKADALAEIIGKLAELESPA